MEKDRRKSNLKLIKREREKKNSTEMRKNDKNNLRKSPEGAREYQVRSGAISIYTCFHRGFIAQSVEHRTGIANLFVTA